MWHRVTEPMLELWCLCSWALVLAWTHSILGMREGSMLVDKNIQLSGLQPAEGTREKGLEG